MAEPKAYLDYLDKEMTIMGILSTFCLAIPALFLERIITADEKSIGHDFLKGLLSNGSTYLVAASILILLAAMFFYKQRSLLAWHYGQIALEISLPNYTARRLDQWLKGADSWETWMPYTFAYWILLFAIVEFVLGITSMSCATLQRFAVHCVIVTVGLIIVWLIWVRRNCLKFKYEEELPYFRIR